MSIENGWKRLAAHAACIAALAAVAAGVSGAGLVKRFMRGEFKDAFITADRYPGIRMIGTAEASDLLSQSQARQAAFIDARSGGAFVRGHVPGALSVPFAGRETVLPSGVTALAREGTLVVYCEGGDCRSSLELARLLHDRGFRDIRVVMGGWAEWTRAGLPVERGT